MQIHHGQCDQLYVDGENSLLDEEMEGGRREEGEEREDVGGGKGWRGWEGQRSSREGGYGGEGGAKERGGGEIAM